MIGKLLPLLIVLAVALCPMQPGVAEASPAWTVLVYMIGTDLEADHGYASADLAEMQEAVRPDTRLLVMTGGANAWSEDIPSDVCTVWEITRAGRTPLATVSGSMGDPQTLAAFLRSDRGGAAHAMLILWDHGFGPMEGFGKDDRYRQDRLSLEELTAALKQTEPFTAIGFDACLMAGCETAIALAPYASWLIASQETEPPGGWDYRFLDTLSDDPVASLSSVVTGYAAFYDDLYSRFPDYWQPSTLSLIDLASADQLQEAVGSLFSGLEALLKDGAFSAISQCRQGAHEFGLQITNTRYDLVDLGELAGQFGELLPAEAAAVTGALKRCVVVSDGSEAQAHGLSVYFPQRADAANRSRWQGPLAGLPWAGFLRDYEMVMDGDTLSGASAGTVSDALYSAELTDEQLKDFASARYFVLTGTPEDGLRLIYAGNDCTLDGHTLTAGYHGQALYLEACGDKFPLTAFWIQDDEEASYYKSFAIVLKDAEPIPEMTNIAMRVRRIGDEWRLLSAIPSESGLSTGRQEIRLEEQDEIWIAAGLYKPVSGEDGMLPYTQWTYLHSMPGWQINFRGEYSLKEEPLVIDEPVWLQLVVRDTHNREYAFPLFRVSQGS